MLTGTFLLRPGWVSDRTQNLSVLKMISQVIHLTQTMMTFEWSLEECIDGATWFSALEHRCEQPATACCVSVCSWPDIVKNEFEFYKSPGTLLLLILSAQTKMLPNEGCIKKILSNYSNFWQWLMKITREENYLAV